MTRCARCCDDARDDATLAALIELGLHHEQQHQELILTDIKHLLSRNPARARVRCAPADDAAPATRAAALDRVATAASRRSATPATGFAFDNETPRHRVWLEPFELASRPVTNGEFLRVHRRRRLPPARAVAVATAGTARQRGGLDGAAVLGCDDGGAGARSRCTACAAIDPHAPVCHLSYFEADAYARWAGARLPTEAEWERRGARPRGRRAGNFAERGALHPLPRRAGRRRRRVQLFGDVWEWTQSRYAPYPGFRPAAGAVGEYNGKFMCNQYVLRGGSCATPPRPRRARRYRNFFPPDARWQFSGVRLARDIR